MIDSVLKGTGNSRFLKSAVPAGTSWADALAMLQAGTFPIDFNGINTEGFQQVGTPLNKANLLKDATAAQIGLPPSTTPDGMFQALGNTGELHVWRKTVKTSSDTPAGYTLGNTLTHGDSFIVRQTNGTGYVDAVIQEASSISVNDNGVISASWGSTITLRYGNSVTFTPGRFVKISSINTKALSSFAVDDVVWVPSDGGILMNFSNDYGYYIEFTKCQKVNAHGIIPAGTTTTYPVSTNPNAYQEGDDAKAAGYVLGDVKTGSFAITSKSSPGGVGTRWNDSTALSVSDDGVCTLATTGGTYIDATTTNAATTAKNELQGKFAYCQNTDTDFTSSVIVFFPSNTTFTKVGNIVYADRYQPVTGYAAIPAGTTIEYLGKLGDKARVQVVSYVGTGTYGENNKNSLTFDFPPKILLIAMAQLYSNQTYTGILYPFVGYGSSLLGADRGYVYSLLCNRNGNSVSWWNKNDYGNQLNVSGYKYTAIAIG